MLIFLFPRKTITYKLLLKKRSDVISSYKSFFLYIPVQVVYASNPRNQDLPHFGPDSPLHLTSLCRPTTPQIGPLSSPGSRLLSTSWPLLTNFFRNVSLRTLYWSVTWNFIWPQDWWPTTLPLESFSSSSQSEVATLLLLPKHS